MHESVQQLSADTDYRLGRWLVRPAIRQLQDKQQSIRLEPKVMSLLLLLIEHNGRVVTHAQIESAIWADNIVAEDTLARTVSKLRRLLGDSAQQPEFIETIPKRGYRLLVSASPVTQANARNRVKSFVLAGLMLAIITVLAVIFAQDNRHVTETDTAPIALMTQRADDHYMRMTRSDNETAAALYERALAMDSDFAPAQYGLANTLVQRTIRWPNRPGTPEIGTTTLADALTAGLTQTPEAKQILTRATALAERAVRLSPEDPWALKALGLTYAAQGDLTKAESIYLQAVGLDANAWPALINLGEIHQIRGDLELAIQRYEEAYAAMSRVYSEQPQLIGRLQAALGVVIGEFYETLQATDDAELWYRKVLDQAPLESDATIRLAAILRRSGDTTAANQLCAELNARVDVFNECPMN